MSQRSLRKVLAAFVGIAVFGSTAANAATTAPASVDPLFAAAVLGTSDSRAAGSFAPAGYSLAAAQGGIGCFAYTPQAIKMAVCGAGGAGKEQVQRMVGTLLGLPEPPSPDHAADALAVAICHGGGSGHRQAVAASAPAPERLAG